MRRHTKVHSKNFAHACDKNECAQSECFFACGRKIVCTKIRLSRNQKCVCAKEKSGLIMLCVDESCL